MSACSGRAARGGLFSYVIHHRPVPGFTPPYAIAVVELDEGPRMMTNITQCPQTPEALQLDMPVEVAFEQLDDQITLPLVPSGREVARCVHSTRALAASSFVMAGLGPAIHGPRAAAQEGVDARNKSGHDVSEFAATAGGQGRIRR